MSQSSDALGGAGLGIVDWAVIESVSGNVVAQGRTQIGAGDVTVDEHRNSDNVTYYRKRIKLSGPFSFSIDEHPTRSSGDLKGFGFKGEKEDHNTFSWEWFNIVNPNEAVKLQEDGRVGIEICQFDKGWEVARTDFLSDVSLRITRFDGDPSLEPFWRVIIKQGSWVAWPPAV
ncbi:hypothetical protein EON82_23490 [bacterium]|nr:MAG: hypothetical protein EON82_23490 [bacterium]